jgi:hypothetical protein
MRKRVIIAGAAALLVAGSAFGLYWFQPWKLFTDKTVTEQLSDAAPTDSAPTDSAPTDSAPTDSAPTGAAPSSTGPARAVVVRQGTFITHEHDTTGTARLVRTAGGTHQLELVGLVTSDGPDLRVWLTDQEVKPGTAGWRVFDDGRYVELGKLKGNRGDQVYAVPADVDPESFRSVSIWCKRFSVSFGAAELR